MALRSRVRYGLAAVVLMVSAVALQPIGRAAAEQASASASASDAAFAQFWEARNPLDAANAAEAVVKSGVSFDTALTRLKRGRMYSSDVPRGVVTLSHRMAAGEFWYRLDVPETYDAARAYQVRVQLHGGVSGRPNGEPRGPASIGALAGAEQIYVIPYAWRDAPWWSDAQVESLRAVLDSLKRTYNVDENRVVLSGVSDGGTGTYYLAMRDTTPFASFLPLNGFIMVLRSTGLQIDHGLFPNNLLNKPFFIVNGGLDRLYPTAEVDPYVEHMKRNGVQVDYRPQPEAGHNTAWWPEMKGPYEAFVTAHPRNPSPAKLTWEADETVMANRAHWLVIDKLGGRGSSVPLRDLNQFVDEPLLNFGVRSSAGSITEVVPSSNAAGFGLRAGDVVTKVNDRTAAPGTELFELLGAFQPPTHLDILVTRDNQPVHLSGTFKYGAALAALPMFDRRRPSGRVDLAREGNTVRATTSGVAAFTLLLSPDAFDFGQPVNVVANGRSVFDGRVSGNVATLMKWAARDNDRTMLFGAEVHVQLTP